MGAMGAAAGAWLARPMMSLARAVPAGRVAVGVCREYDADVTGTLARMFDQLGGLEGLVRGKTVAIKLNLTGDATDRLGYLPAEITHWVHPQVIGATVQLLGQAGARAFACSRARCRPAEPLEEFMLQANWEPRDFVSAAPRVEFENTNYLGYGKKYSRFWVPDGGLMFKGYDLNHSYEDCDVFVSLAKLKEHVTAGVTLSMKNCFGITPCTIYGDGSPVDEPSLTPRGGRGPFHEGNRLPSKSAPPPVNAPLPRRTRATECRAWWRIWWRRGPCTWPSSTESTAWRAGKARGVTTCATSNPACWSRARTAWPPTRCARRSWASTPWRIAAPLPSKPATARCAWRNNSASALAILAGSRCSARPSPKRASTFESRSGDFTSPSVKHCHSERRFHDPSAHHRA